MPYWRHRRPKVPPAIPRALLASWLLAYTRAALSIHSTGIFCISPLVWMMVYAGGNKKRPQALNPLLSACSRFGQKKTVGS